MALEFWVEIIKAGGAVAGPVLGYLLSTLRMRRKRLNNATITLKEEIREILREGRDAHRVVVVETLVQYLGSLRRQQADVNETVGRLDTRVADAIGRLEQHNMLNREERQAVADRIVALQKSIERKIVVDEELAVVVADLRKVLS